MVYLCWVVRQCSAVVTRNCGLSVGSRSLLPEVSLHCAARAPLLLLTNITKQISDQFYQQRKGKRTYGVLAKWRGMHAPILTIVTNHILQLHVQIRLVSVDKHIFRPYSDGTSLLQLPNLQGRGTSCRWGVNFPFGNLEFGGNSFGERFSLLQLSSIQHCNTAWHTKLVCKVLVWVSTRLDD